MTRKCVRVALIQQYPFRKRLSEIIGLLSPIRLMYPAAAVENSRLAIAMMRSSVSAGQEPRRSIVVRLKAKCISEEAERRLG
jgi:hypothetical protein